MDIIDIAKAAGADERTIEYIQEELELEAALNIDKFLLTEDFKGKFAEFCKLETDAEKEDFFDRCGTEYKQKTPEEQSFMDKKAWDGVLAIGDRIAKMVQEAQQLVAPKRRIA